MRMRRSAASAVAVAFVVAGLTGCTPPDPTNTVAVALPNDGARWGQVATVLRDRLDDAGYSVELRTADDDIPTQVGQVAELLDASPAALIVAPIDVGSLTPALEAAPDHVEVVSLGSLVGDTAAVDRFVAFDPALEGSMQAGILVRALFEAAPGVAAPEGPFTVELFAGSVDDWRTQPAFDAAIEVLEPYLDDGRLRVGSGETSLAEVTTLRGEGATAAARLTRILNESYPGTVPDAVLAPSDAIARGVTESLLRAGAVAGDTFPVVTGRGAELRSLVALLDGRQYSTLLEDPRALANEAAARLLDLLAADPGILPDPTIAPPGSSVDNGARLVPASFIDPVPVLAGDIDERVIRSGYWSRARLDAAIEEFGVAPVVP